MQALALFDLAGQVALVTGGASGIGLAIAEGLAEARACVVVADRDAEGAAAASAHLRQGGLLAEPATVDVTDRAALEHLVLDIQRRHGRLDAVFANAGISAGPGPGLGKGLLEEIQREDWERVLAVNLTGVLATFQAAARPMKEQGRGRLIATASTAAFRGDGMVGYSYVAAKAAVMNIVRQAAIELAPHGILVNAIAPGPFRTNIGNGRMREDEVAARFAQRVPLNRLAEPHEIKGAAILLASAASSYMTGSVVSVDGGALAW